MIRDIDPDLARSLAWAWDQVGRPVSESHMMESGADSRRAWPYTRIAGRASQGFLPRELHSTWLPGFGATMRAFPGDPNETYLSYHQGYWSATAMPTRAITSFTPRARPWSPSGHSSYSIVSTAPPFQALYKEFGWHSRVHFASRTNGGGWPGGGPISAGACRTPSATRPTTCAASVITAHSAGRGRFCS